jgi:aromatic-amino-acid transaminase
MTASALSTASSLFGAIEPFAGDPILSLFETFKADARPGKVNLGIGVYTDEAGRIPVLAPVLAARDRLGFGPRPYLPMEGYENYRRGVQRLVFGEDHPALAAGRIATVQTLGGTGAVSLAADFLAKHCPGRTVYVSDPTWENHHGLFQRAGFRTTTYPYFDAQSRAVAFEAMIDTLERAAEGSIVVIQPVCHNPTGLDLDRAQEDALTALMLRRGHIAVFDMAYQGFGEGLEEDAGFVRRYAARAQCLVANSFSKNFSLYGERCGGLSVVCGDADEAERALGQLKLAVRRSYSSPPLSGGLIVAEVLNDPALREAWEGEVATMRERMKAMRRRLADAIVSLSNATDTSFLTEQRGMFSYTGLSAAQVRAMRDEDGVYLVETGRLCVAGLNPGNVDAVARSFVRASDVANGA